MIKRRRVMMIRVPEMYIPTDKEWAFHPQIGHPNAKQWWYHDLICDNGYTAVIGFHVDEFASMIVLDISTPDGKVISNVPGFHFDRAAVVASTDTLDIKMGDNYLRQKWPRREVYYRSGDLGVELVYEAITHGVKEPADGIYV